MPPLTHEQKARRARERMLEKAREFQTSTIGLLSELADPQRRLVHPTTERETHR